MRLGGYVFYDGTDPEQYALAHVAKGFGAAVVPHWVSLEDPSGVKAFKQVMKKHDVTIAEVGAWCNPMHPDKREAESKIQYMIERLKLAEELEACTCVNILGSKSTVMWDGPCMEGYSQSFFDEAVQLSQRVIDAVKPQHTKLSFEMMPFYFLDGPEAYLQFLKAIDRKEAAVHLDICNTMNHPARLCDNTNFIKHTFNLLSHILRTIVHKTDKYIPQTPALPWLAVAPRHPAFLSTLSVPEFPFVPGLSSVPSCFPACFVSALHSYIPKIKAAVQRKIHKRFSFDTSCRLLLRFILISGFHIKAYGFYRHFTIVIIRPVSRIFFIYH